MTLTITQKLMMQEHDNNLWLENESTRIKQKREFHNCNCMGKEGHDCNAAVLTAKAKLRKHGKKN